MGKFIARVRTHLAIFLIAKSRGAKPTIRDPISRSRFEIRASRPRLEISERDRCLIKSLGTFGSFIHSRLFYSAYVREIFDCVYVIFVRSVSCAFRSKSRILVLWIVKGSYLSERCFVFIFIIDLKDSFLKLMQFMKIVETILL